MSNLFVYHADICKTFSNPKRLEIINALRGNVELTASDLLEKIEIKKANLSQNMSVLVQKGIVNSRREGINIYYKLSDKRITEACDLMRDVLIKNLNNQAKIVKLSKK
ncbi:MAG: hypothetical protein A2Y40_03770 [Candidatus Margulisbacteria bacterium GWF2_35_9]|nr:MAG: hypothetical protein A2Y40_03770 [Candidatus Margulisbacteria bacterium GWF2_35_9]